MFTFTTLGTFGQFGPSSNRAYANFPWSSNSFSIQNGIQKWTVPTTGTYTVTAAGATSTRPGNVVTSSLSLTQGQVVSILVGQMPSSLSQPSTITAGGGGGTYVMSDTTPLLTAPGGSSGSGTLVPGANVSSNGSATNSIYPYTYPRSYIDGGIGSPYLYGNYSGGFGGGQAPIGVPNTIQTIAGDGTTCTVTTTSAHGYPIVYNALIYGTVNFNGTYQIKTTSPTQFTFLTNKTGSETSTGYVTGLVSGTSGGGGNSYGGTDLGAISNTSGYVTVQYGSNPSLVSWDGTRPWYSVASYQPNSYAKVWFKNKFISISSQTPPIISTSTDGITWTYPIVNGIQPDSFGSLTTSADQSIICTSNGYSSPDGITWTRNTGVDTKYVNYLNGMFIAPNKTGTSVYTSTNGTSWTSITTNKQLTSVQAFGKGKYVGITTDYPSNLAYSDNLANWTNITDDIYSCVGFFNNLFIAGGSHIEGSTSVGIIKTSDDGITWTQRFSGYKKFLCTQYINNKIIALDSEGSCISSVDGYTWVAVATNQFNYIQFPNPPLNLSAYSGASSPDICVFQAGGPAYITNGTIFITSSNVLQNNPVDIVYSKELGLFAATTGKSVCTSKDGYTWVESFIGSVYSILWSSELGIFIAYSPGVASYTSNDGVQWTLSTVIPTLSTDGPPLLKPYRVGGLYTWSKELGIFAVGDSISKDGINWKATNNGIYNNITWCSGLKMFCGSTAQYNCNISYSYDGINWNPGPSFSYVSCIATNGSFFVGLCGNYFYKSINGTTWDQTQFIIDNTPTSAASIVWAQEIGRFVAIFNGNSVAQSSDGYSWAIIQTLNTDKNNTDIGAMCWSGTKFAAVGSKIPGVLISPI
jgi:hypothetical protein